MSVNIFGVILHVEVLNIVWISTVTKATGWAVATAGINSKVDVCEKAKHHTELFW